MAIRLPEWISSRFVWLERVVTGESPAPQSKPSPYHAIAIRPGPNCCQGAQVIGGKRFLSRKAPSLPLPGCDAVTCRCVYTHFSDRRSGVDRRAPDVWNPHSEQMSENRRQNRGRRSTDARW